MSLPLKYKLYVLYTAIVTEILTVGGMKGDTILTQYALEAAGRFEPCGVVIQFTGIQQLRTYSSGETPVAPDCISTCLAVVLIIAFIEKNLEALLYVFVYLIMG